MSISIATKSLTIESTRGEPLSVFLPDFSIILRLVENTFVSGLSIILAIYDSRRMDQFPIDIAFEEDLVKIGFGAWTMRQDRGCWCSLNV